VGQSEKFPCVYMGLSTVPLFHKPLIQRDFTFQERLRRVGAIARAAGSTAGAFFPRRSMRLSAGAMGLSLTASHATRLLELKARESPDTCGPRTAGFEGTPDRGSSEAAVEPEPGFRRHTNACSSLDGSCWRRA
jgi:hypothetical protein